jgi:nucleoside-diphosphate-sugar epimerase
MRLLVTGAAGFVASHLIPWLSREGHEVYALDRDRSRIAGLPATPVEQDLSQPLGALPGVDAIVHLAQANVKLPDEAPLLFAVNAGSTVELLDHARRSGAERFLYASTGTVYGFGDRPFHEADEPAGRDLYAVSKLSGELAVEAYAPHFSTFVARLWAPYGPGQRSRMIPRLIDRVRAGEPVQLTDGGRPRMNPTYVDDVCRVFTAALELDGHHVVNVAGDEVVGIGDLARLIGAAVGREPVLEQAVGGAPGDVIADTTRLHELLDLRPLVPLSEGLRVASRSS